MDSVYDDRKFAIEEARKIDQGSRYSGVRVVEENYDETTNEVTSRTLYRGGVAKSDNIGKKAIPAPRSAPRRGTGRESECRTPRRSKTKKSSLLVPVLILMVIILGGLAALFGLQQLSSLS